MNVKLMMVVCLVLASSAVIAGEKQELKTQKDRLSYAVGLDMGSSLKKNDIDVDPDVVARGIKDVLSGSKPLMTDEEVKAVIVAVQKDIRAKLRKKNEDFLAENRKKKGIKVLRSGLQYKVITAGKGKSPKATDTVTVNYRGTLIDGTEFDSSVKRGQPATFPVSAVISGWAEALQLMKAGSKWQLFIPANLAYGEIGRPGIPPNAALIFELELISIKEQ
jgi:FKBP-type peptidyl-prolyl cis-trans isomerase FklB